MSLTISNVSKRFGGDAAIDGLSADIPGGAFFTVLGPSGCGKSTLLRLLAGLETADGGEIRIGGRPVAGPGLHVAPESRDVAVVFQSYALWPHMTVRENVAFPIETAGASRKQAAAAAGPHLDTVALSALADRRPAELSGGQRQRVALARCLASRAGTVLMDEPLANLDPHLRGAMEEELIGFHRDSGATLLYITHDQREAMAMADLVAVMEAGRFLQVAPPEEIHDRPASARVAGFIGAGAVLRAELRASEGTEARVRLGDGSEITATCRPGQRPGPVGLLIRPDWISADPGGRPATLHAPRYRGGHWEARAALPGLGADLPVRLAARPQDGAEIGLRLTRAWVLPEAG